MKATGLLLALAGVATLVGASSPEVVPDGPVMRVRSHRYEQYRRQRFGGGGGGKTDLGSNKFGAGGRKGATGSKGTGGKSTPPAGGSTSSSTPPTSTKTGQNNAGGGKGGQTVAPGNGGKGGGKGTTTTPPPPASTTAAAPPSQESILAAIKAQEATQDANFVSAQADLAKQFTKASDNNNNAKGDKNPALQTDLCLAASQIQQGSFSPGSPAAGQVNSATSTNNYINHCAQFAVPLTNGLQQPGQSCSGIPLGLLVGQSKAPATKWKFPTNGAKVAANKDFTLELSVTNLVTGLFTDATHTYFGAPQDVDPKTGFITGHPHFVCRQLPSCADTTVHPVTEFIMFKGIDDAAINGVNSFTVLGGFPQGSVQCSTIVTSQNHTPVIVTRAQRWPSDDSICFEMV